MSSPTSTLTSTLTSEFTTTEPDVAHDWLRSAYAGYEPEDSNSSAGFRFRGTQRPLGSGNVSHLTYSTTADNNVELSDVLLVLDPSDGRMRVSLGHDEAVVSPGTPVLFPPHQVLSALWVDTDAGCICLRAADVERVAVETTGMDTITLRFSDVRPMTPELGRRWHDAVRLLLTTVLRDPVVAGSPVVAGELIQRLAAAALATFPSTTLASHPRIPPGHVEPAVVRRAIDFIDANADRDMTLSTIAAASGAGPRGLQAAFLRHADTTPTAYARRVRLEAAHRDLQSADPAGDTTVGAVAARRGFADRHRFADEYERTFHQPPQESLRA
jgi:AraC-like DNA-binding protein